MKPRRTQRGVVLVFSLIMLLVMTVIGVAALRENQIQTMMAANTQYQTFAFNAAEDRLAQVEQALQDNRCGYSTLTELKTDIKKKFPNATVEACWQWGKPDCDKKASTPNIVELKPCPLVNKEIYRIRIRQSSVSRGEQKTLESLYIPYN